MNSSRALKQLFLNLRNITRDILQLMLESSLDTTILVKINSFTGIFQWSNLLIFQEHLFQKTTLSSSFQTWSIEYKWWGRCYHRPLGRLAPVKTRIYLKNPLFFSWTLSESASWDWLLSDAVNNAFFHHFSYPLFFKRVKSWKRKIGVPDPPLYCHHVERKQHLILTKILCVPLGSVLGSFFSRLRI